MNTLNHLLIWDSWKYFSDINKWDGIYLTIWFSELYYIAIPCPDWNFHSSRKIKNICFSVSSIQYWQIQFIATFSNPFFGLYGHWVSNLSKIWLRNGETRCFACNEHYCRRNSITSQKWLTVAIWLSWTVIECHGLS